MPYQTGDVPIGPRAGRRRGFTLVEVLMVVVIIGLLLGLLLPAINSAVVRAREARVATEIQSLASAIADFKAQFGFEPPSRLVLFENPADWNASNTAATRESRAALRRMFPQMDFTIARDFDGDGTPDERHTLSGPECLVFFLGGVQELDPSSGMVTMTGFAKNPRDPFSRTDKNRLGPFFSEFNTGRLVDALPQGSPNGMYEFLDPLPNQSMPYVYVSSNDGRGYDVSDVAGTGFRYAYFHPGLFEDTNYNGRLDPGEDQNNNGRLDVPTFHNPKSYQIISAGYDGQYGSGGAYDPDNPESSLAQDRPPDQAEAERDNITNFHPSRLAP